MAHLCLLAAMAFITYVLLAGIALGIQKRSVPTPSPFPPPPHSSPPEGICARSPAYSVPLVSSLPQDDWF